MLFVSISKMISLFKFNKFKFKVLCTCLNISCSAVVICKNIFLERYNYKPYNYKQKCTETEVKCRNSYSRKICVKKEVKHLACAEYTTKLCYDDEFYIHIYEKNKILNR